MASLAAEDDLKQLDQYRDDEVDDDVFHSRTLWFWVRPFVVGKAP
jgi:hypothetical protein